MYSINKKILDKIIADGFYEVKTPEPSGNSLGSYMHRAYAMTPSGIIISYSSGVIKTKDGAPLNFSYIQVDAETGNHHGASGSYYTNYAKGVKGLPHVIQQNYKEAKKFINHAKTSKELKYHRSLPQETRNNFGDICTVSAGVQSEYYNNSKIGIPVFGKDLNFMIDSKNYLIAAKQAYDAAHPQIDADKPKFV